MLVAIGCYERWMSPGGQGNKGFELITSGKDKAMSLFRRLPRMLIVDAFVGSGSKELLSAVLRAEVDLDHNDYYSTATAMADDQVGARHVDASSTATFGNNRPVPAPLVIGDNPYEESQISDREDLGHMTEQQRQGRGRDVSMASRQDPLDVSPTTPTRSQSGQRRNAIGLNLGVGSTPTSPVARSYGRRRLRPMSVVEGRTWGARSGHGPHDQIGASNDDVLAALRRLESALAKEVGGKGAEKEGEKEKGIGSAPSGSQSDQATMLKDLGERQTRIEGLLLTLTREMRS